MSETLLIESEKPEHCPVCGSKLKQKKSSGYGTKLGCNSQDPECGFLFYRCELIDVYYYWVPYYQAESKIKKGEFK